MSKTDEGQQWWHAFMQQERGAPMGCAMTRDMFAGLNV